MGAAEPGIPPEPDLPDDLRHGHRPPTGTSTQLAIHTRPVTCDFTMHTAHWAHFENARLVRAGLSRIKAHHALFDGADLRGARLAESDLSGAWFRHTRVDEVDFTDADIHQTDLYSTSGLTVEQILTARPTSWTVLPHAMRRDPQVVARIMEVEAEQGPDWSSNPGFEVVARAAGFHVAEE